MEYLNILISLFIKIDAKKFLDLKNILINNKTKSLSIVCSICFSHTHFVKMSDNGEVYCGPFLFDKDNIGSVLLGNFTAHIHKDGEEVEIRLERGVLLLKHTGHDENLDHVFRIEFIQNREVTCMFWGLLEMEYQGWGKHFTVTSQEFSTEVGVNALRQILPDENISDDILASYPNEGNDEEVQDEGYEEEEEENDPALNLGERFADAADDASDDDEASDDDASDDEATGQS